MLKASKNTVERLYQYRNALNRLKSIGFVKVFSDNLADGVGVGATQVRKDFSVFGLSGNKKGGYLIDDLITKLDTILGKNTQQRVVVVGCGNVGKALVNYQGFEKEGIKIAAGFDIDPNTIRRDSAPPVLPFEEFEEFVKKNKIKTGVIAVSDQQAQQVADRMMAAGIKGILNFAQIRLNVPEDLVLNNVNLGIELETVIYFVNAMGRGKAA